MEPALNNYVRVHRRRMGLTQKELATLTSWGSHSVVSRIEWSKASPDLATAISCELIFDAPMRELFPGKYHDAGVTVAQNARRLAAQLPATAPGSDRKFEVLDQVLARLASNL